MTVLHSVLAAGGLPCQVDDVMDSILDHTMWLQLTAGGAWALTGSWPPTAATSCRSCKKDFSG